MSDYKPDYSRYCLSELLIVRKKIDRDRHPENYQALEDELARRMEDPEVQKEMERIEKERLYPGGIKGVWRGNIRLSTAFWILWLLPSLVVFFLNGLLAYHLITQKAFLRFGFISSLLNLLFFLFTIFCAVVIWRSGRKLSAKMAIWKYLSRIPVSIVLFFMLLVAGNLVYRILYISLSDTDAYIKTLKPTENYPMIGAWKRDCKNSYGLAIDKASEGRYNVTFFGPGGYFKPGSDGRSTTIKGDPRYRIIDDDTIEVSSSDGFDRYYRCSSSVDSAEKEKRTQAGQDASTEKPDDTVLFKLKRRDGTIVFKKGEGPVFDVVDKDGKVIEKNVPLKGDEQIEMLRYFGFGY